MITAFGANVQNETFSVLLRHFVSDESNNTGALAKRGITSHFRINGDLSGKRGV